MYRHVNLRVQTKATSEVGGEQALAESLELTQELFRGVGDAMAAGMEAWPERKAALEAAAAERRQRETERAVKMARWIAMVQEKAEPWDRELEVELFGKVISKDLEGST